MIYYWLYDSQFSLFYEYFPEFHYFSVSGMNQRDIQCGRPYGGVTILYKAFHCKITPISFECNRVIALFIDIDKLPI